MEGHRDLIAWQKAMDLVTLAYSITREFPKEELNGLTSQMRRCTVSVPSNLAEGWGRNSRNEFRHFIGQARGSLAELDTQIEIAFRLSYISRGGLEEVLGKLREVARLLSGLKTWTSAKPGDRSADYRLLATYY